ncbi:hypothetical protein B0H14DRAFT_3046212, partial [Mycena olivaceomarginata]
MIQSYPLASKNPESKQLYTVATIGKCPSDCDRLALPADAGLENRRDQVLRQLRYRQEGPAWMCRQASGQHVVL